MNCCFRFFDVTNRLFVTIAISTIFGGTGKSFSEALILAPIKPQYDERLFIEFQERYKFATCCVQIMFRMSKQKNNFCKQHVANLCFSWKSMNNLSSYCGLTESRMRSSDIDLPVHKYRKNQFYIYSMKMYRMRFFFYFKLNITVVK